MHMKSLEDYSLTENVVLSKYNRRWKKRRKQVKAEESVLSQRKMILALRKALYRRAGAE